ncbi:hypothetical protein RQP46_001658 [Phenoliferia psychrophenolica]
MVHFASLLLTGLLAASEIVARSHGSIRRGSDHHKALAPVVARGRAVEPRSSTSEFVLYSDKWTNNGSPPAASEIPGWTVFSVSFWLASGAADMAQGWMQLSADARAAIKKDYAANGIKLLVTAFGETDTPTSSGEDPATTATALAKFVTDYDLDGCDIDYEDFAAMSAGTAEAWLITLTETLRAALPNAIITHAPVAPWFTTDTSSYPGGGYLEVNKKVGSSIDWYNVQLYNQGTTEYTSCDTLLTKSVSFPETSLFEIIANGVSADKLLIGKPAIASDATNGYMTPAALAVCVNQARAKGWNAGVMCWEFPDEPVAFLTDRIFRRRIGGVLIRLARRLVGQVLGVCECHLGHLCYHLKLGIRIYELELLVGQRERELDVDVRPLVLLCGDMVPTIQSLVDSRQERSEFCIRDSRDWLQFRRRRVRLDRRRDPRASFRLSLQRRFVKDGIGHQTSRIVHHLHDLEHVQPVW